MSKSNDGFVIDSDGYVVPLEPVGIRQQPNENQQEPGAGLKDYLLTVLSKEDVEKLIRRSLED